MFTTSLYANTLEELEDQKKGKEDAIESNQGNLKEFERILQETNLRIQELDNDMKATQVVIDDLDVQLVEKQDEIQGTKEQLEEAKKEEAEYHQQVKDRMKIMYEYGNSGYMEVLLESSSLSDFFNRLEYLTKIFKYDENMLMKLDDIKAGIETKEIELEIEEATLEDLKADANQQKQALEELVIQKAIEIESVESNIELLNEQIKAEEEELKRLDEAIEKKKIELSNYFTDGVFDWPAPGVTWITEYFGSRIHPIFGTPEFHNGLDIGTPYGTTIVAAETGSVVFAGWSNSGGNMVILSHGYYEGCQYLTYYLHNSKLLVSEGDIITRGTPIAQAGSTGWSTGNHLHFGVKKDNVWVNPLDYFEKN